MLVCCSDDLVAHLLQVGEVGSVDLRSSRALILSNISTRTGSVLIRCRPEGICCDTAFRMMVRKINSSKWGSTRVSGDSVFWAMFVDL